MSTFLDIKWDLLVKSTLGYKQKTGQDWLVKAMKQNQDLLLSTLLSRAITEICVCAESALTEETTVSEPTCPIPFTGTWDSSSFRVNTCEQILSTKELKRFAKLVRSETYHHIFDDYKAFANWYLRSVALQTEQSSTSDVLHLALLWSILSSTKDHFHSCFCGQIRPFSSSGDALNMLSFVINDVHASDLYRMIQLFVAACYPRITLEDISDLNFVVRSDLLYREIQLIFACCNPHLTIKGISALNLAVISGLEYMGYAAYDSTVEKFCIAILLRETQQQFPLSKLPSLQIPRATQRGVLPNALQLAADKKCILREHAATSHSETSFDSLNLLYEKVIECDGIAQKAMQTQEQAYTYLSLGVSQLSMLLIYISVYNDRMKFLPTYELGKGVGNDHLLSLSLCSNLNGQEIIMFRLLNDYMSIHCDSSETKKELLKNFNQILSKPVKKFLKDSLSPDYRRHHSADLSNKQKGERDEEYRSRLVSHLTNREDIDKFTGQPRYHERQDSEVTAFEELSKEEPQTSGERSLDIGQLERVVRELLLVQSEAHVLSNENTPAAPQQTGVQTMQEAKVSTKSKDQNTNKAVSYNELAGRYLCSQHETPSVTPSPVSSVEHGIGVSPAQAILSSDSLKLSCRNMDHGNENEHLSVTAEMLVTYEYEEVKQATGGFDMRPKEKGGHKLGAGSFAEVFYGQLHDAVGVMREVAVKKLKQLKDCKESQLELRHGQLPTELMALTRYCHPNIIHLLGQCKGPEPCLVFEYVPGKNLAMLLAQDNPNPLKWPVRLKVLRDVADALNYLHTAQTPALVHRDVKSANILLTDNLEGRLADFGLSMLTQNEDDPQASFCVGTAAGTRSYMPPEAFKGRVSPRLDIYSFGMVIYEVLTGLQSYSSTQKQDLVTYMRKLIRKGSDLHDMLDPRSEWPHGLADDLLKLAANCTDDNSHRRPPMAKVLSVLEILMNNSLRPPT